MAGKIANVQWFEGSFVETLKGVASRVVLHHRATRSELDRTPRVPIRTPYAAHVLERDGPVVGQQRRGD